MSNQYFRFKQFSVLQDKCAMKVGTDAVILGAYVDLPEQGRVLDVGTGTGVLTLMMAQRGGSHLRFTALEIDDDAFNQARENVRNSPWQDKIDVVCADYLQFFDSQSYELIVSNPPYFQNSLSCPDFKRQIARHTDTLNYRSLIAHSVQLLSDTGRLTMILPYDSKTQIEQLASEYSLFVIDTLTIYPKPFSEPKRCVITLSKQYSVPTNSTLTIELERHQYTDEYISLTKEYYLKM